MTRLRLLACLAIVATTARGDTIGTGEMPPWMERCGPLETLRIVEGPVPMAITSTILAAPPSIYTQVTPAPPGGAWPIPPVPAAVAAPAAGGLLLTALALMLRRRRG